MDRKHITEKSGVSFALHKGCYISRHGEGGEIQVSQINLNFVLVEEHIG